MDDCWREGRKGKFSFQLTFGMAGEKWLSQDPEGMELVERCHAAYVKVGLRLESPPT